MYQNINNSQRSSRSFLNSLAIHSILLLFAFFFKLNADLTPPDPPIEKEFEIDIDIPEVRAKMRKPPRPKIEKLEEMNAETSNSTKAEADKGESRPLNPEVQKVEVNDPKPPPAKVEPTPTPAPTPKPTPAPPAKAPTTSPTPAPKPSTQSPVVTKESDVEVDAPKKEAPVTKPAPAPSPSTTSGNGGGKPSSNPPSSPTTSPTSGKGTVGSTTGTGDKPQSNTDGNGKGKSDSGTGLGDGKGSDVTSGSGNTSDGTGEYDGSGNGIFNRHPVYSNWRAFPLEQSGTVVMKVCINREGNVTFAEVMPATTIKDKSLLRRFVKAIRGYKYAKKPSAPEEECGKFTYKIDLSAVNKLRAN
jgi:outer membrane biosynthesis protein TonB